VSNTHNLRSFHRERHVSCPYKTTGKLPPAHYLGISSALLEGEGGTITCPKTELAPKSIFLGYWLQSIEKGTTKLQSDLAFFHNQPLPISQ
jgi:hypothetical protein